MSYKIVRDQNQQPSIILYDEPIYCESLEAAPLGREQKLNDGVWLIMTFAAWSVHDVNAIKTALDVAKHFKGGLKLGLRPYDDSEDHNAWLPGPEQNNGSPLWVLLNGGELLMKQHGLFAESELVNSISAIGVVRDGI